jgi:hypothetical protein
LGVDIINGYLLTHHIFGGFGTGADKYTNYDNIYYQFYFDIKYLLTDSFPFPYYGLDFGYYFEDFSNFKPMLALAFGLLSSMNESISLNTSLSYKLKMIENETYYGRQRQAMQYVSFNFGIIL